MASFLDGRDRRFSEPMRPSRSEAGADASSVIDGQMTVVLRSGWLTKQGHRFFKSWRRRWFVLTPSHLVYTLRPAAIRSRGSIDLNAVTSVAPVPLRGVQGMAILTLPGHKDYMIIGDDLPTWIREVRSACRALASGVPLTHMNPMAGMRASGGPAEATARGKHAFLDDTGRASPSRRGSASDASTGERDDAEAHTELTDPRGDHEAVKEVARLSRADRPMLVGVALSALERAIVEDGSLSPPGLSELRGRAVLAVRALRERQPDLWSDVHASQFRRVLDIIAHKQRARRPVISPSARPMRRRSAIAGLIPGTGGAGALESAVPALMGRPTLPVTATTRVLALGGSQPRTAKSSGDILGGARVGPGGAGPAASGAGGGLGGPVSVVSLASSGAGGALGGGAFGGGPTSASSVSTAPQASFHDLFELQEELGRGAFSVVHKTRHRRSGRDFAVKVLNREAMTDDDVQSLVGEVSTQRYLRHPNVVRLVAFFDSDPERFFLVTELCTGGELFHRIVKQTRFSEREAAGYVYVLLDAIGYFHKHGIVHRDLKPENILFQDARPGAPLKIADFGFAVHNGTGETLRSLAGSPNYLAPEIVSNRPYGVAVDVWSLGVITYILLCGYMPFDHPRQSELFRIISSGRFTFPAKDWDAISPEAKDFVSRLLVVDPRDRLTAEAALRHRWITTTDLSDAHLSRSVGKLRSFHSKRRASMLRNAVRAVHFGRRASSAAVTDSPRRAVALRNMGVNRAASAMLGTFDVIPPSPVVSMAINADPADDETRFNGMLDSPRVVADTPEPLAKGWAPTPSAAAPAAAASAGTSPSPSPAVTPQRSRRGRPRSMTAPHTDGAFIDDILPLDAAPRAAAAGIPNFLPRPPPGSPPVA